MKWKLCVCFLLLVIVGGARPASAYAVFTHEAVIDSAWKDIEQVLHKRFPAATPDELKEAHAYAYGGCVIQDMGYYPFGSHYFSDLVHYTRSGDFVMALLRDAGNLDETAFALGALAHYSSDNDGHPIAVNRAVSIEYPELRAKYGPEVTYGENPTAHLKTEFGFDVVEIAQGHYASDDYHNFIGFKVSKELLERAFQDTYGIDLKKQFKSLDVALGTYRRTASVLLPEAVKVAWAQKGKEIVKARPGMTKRQFMYNLSRASYEKEWGKEYERPGIFARFLAFLLRIVPKVGPFKTLSFKAPTAQTEALFMKSFNDTLASYRNNLALFASGKLQLANLDFDTGRPTRSGEYRLADETYAKLLRQLAKQNFQGMTPELKSNLLAFYADPKPLQDELGKARKKDRKDWSDTLEALAKLKALDTNAPVAGQ